MLVKKLLTTAGTMTVLGMALTSSAFANYDGHNHHFTNHVRDHHMRYASVNNNQSANDWGNYDTWWSARGNNWDNSRNLNADWNDYVSWSEQNNLSWLTTRGKDWEYSDFQNWWNNHMNGVNNNNSENCTQ